MKPLLHNSSYNKKSRNKTQIIKLIKIKKRKNQKIRFLQKKTQFEMKIRRQKKMMKIKWNQI